MNTPKPRPADAVKPPRATAQSDPDLIAYAKLVLTQLAIDQDWGADTVGAIGKGAVDLGLAAVGHTGEFMPTPKSGVVLAAVESQETKESKRAVGELCEALEQAIEVCEAWSAGMHFAGSVQEVTQRCKEAVAAVHTAEVNRLHAEGPETQTESLREGGL